ncbi:EexN family lipoprotein [Mesorhizobium sp. CA8]|uniref:EexN family lipoprotein n=1 Tax=unclassified Mesorhizobium TaxID=325217 RepID=UPI001CCAA617|nr:MULTISPECIES: EexN family lipoprotein [unclassified Mesorhizobium]MBZ9764777.1 EexN family lipoprotein [Mesorhizobium sp. CA8]MBZ9822786.1 EexN family lipoprotein [Mesorhizobium sp. CA4]
MRRLLLLAAIVGLAACSEQTELSYTVDELVADEALLSSTLTKCRNNPGELRDTTNCRNAEAADGKLRLQRMRQSLGG